MARTVTGMFNSYDEASSAVRELESLGIPHSDISIVANNADDRWSGDGRPATSASADDASGTETGASVGAVLGGGAGLLAGLGMLAIPGLGPVVAAGWLASTAVGAVAGAATGGVVGALTDAGVSREDAEVYAEGVRRGGALVSARVDEPLAARAEAILRGSRAIDPAKRRAAYHESGWTGFDPHAEPYTTSQIERERTLY